MTSTIFSPRRQSMLVLSSLALLLAAGPHAGAVNQVITVDAGGGADFSDLAAAVAAAGEGDVLLVKDGSYSPVVIDDKSLVLVADVAPGTSADLFQLTVRNLASGKHVVVRGFRIDSFFTSPTALELDQNDGTVVIEDCSIGPVFQGNVTATGNDSVFLVRSTLVGADGTEGFVFPSTPPKPALVADLSNVFVYDSSITGGKGPNAVSTPAGIQQAGLGGAPGIVATGGTVLVSGGTTTGGEGGAPLELATGCLGAGDGGPAIRLLGNAHLRRLDAALTGGTGGAPTAACPGATNGLGIQALAGTVETIPEIARSVELSAVVREGQAANVTLAGLPGDVVVLFHGFLTTGLYFPGLQGSLLVGLPPLVAVIGPLPASPLSLPVTIPANQVQAPVEGFSLFVQPLVAGQSGLGLLGAPSVLTVLDSTF